MLLEEDQGFTDTLLHEVMDVYDAEQDAQQHLQNLHLQSGSGSQETDTEAAIPLAQGAAGSPSTPAGVQGIDAEAASPLSRGAGSPVTPVDLAENLDDSDYMPSSSEYVTSSSDSEADSGDSVEVIQETQVQEEEVQSTQAGLPSSQPVVSQPVVSQQGSAAPPGQDSGGSLGDSQLDEEAQQRIIAQAEEFERLAAALRRRVADAALLSARRRRDEPGSPPRNVRARRGANPRGTNARQLSIRESLGNGERARASAGAPTPAQVREPRVERRLSAHPERFEIPEPRDEAELYEKWTEALDDVVPEDANIYSNFRYAFGDDTDEGRRYREAEIKAIAKTLFEFQRTRKPGQHAMLKGREREGKTGALFSIALAALLLRMRVVILCAPNKVAPVVDMVRKIRLSGFGKYWNVRHTLGKKASRDNDVPSSDIGQIFVAALGTVTDLRRVKNFIVGEERGGHQTVTLIDECDELTQGRGGNSLAVERRDDPDLYQQFIRPDSRGEDEEDDDIPIVDPDAPGARARTRKDDLAKASHFFKTELHERTQVIACSATLSGYMLNPVGVFRNDLETSIFMVYPKAGYRGVDTFSIPEGCALETEGNLSMDAFKESEAVGRMIKRFYARENECDGAQLLPRDGFSGGAVTLRGVLFISCSPKVNVYGGVKDIAGEVCTIVDGWGDEHDSKATLFVCFVGSPAVKLGSTWLRMPSGASLETMYNRAAVEARKGTFRGVRLGANEPFSAVCKHCVLIGYNLTRRAMTAAFRPADEPGVLCKLQYGILAAPKTLTIDAVSQRINRPSHDFGEHVVPENYCVDVAMSSLALEMCQKFRKLEDDMVEEQRRSPLIHAEFRQNIKVFAEGLEKTRVSKRNILLGELSRTGRLRAEQKEREEIADRDPALRRFKTWLKEYRWGQRKLPFSENTVDTYYRIVREFFFDQDDVSVVKQRAEDELERIRAIANRTSAEGDKYSATRRFVEFIGGGPRMDEEEDESREIARMNEHTSQRDDE